MYSWKRLILVAFISGGMTLSVSLLAQAGSFLKEMQVSDSCGSIYADNLAICMPFHCTKSSPMAAMYATIPKDAQAKLEKKIEKLSSKQLAAMKAKMTSYFEIKGLDIQGRCQTITMVIPGQRIDCLFDKPAMQQMSDYSRLIAKATDFESDSTSHVINGKMVTESTVTIDGVNMVDPWTTALNNGQCRMMIEDPDVGWIPMSKMNHFKFNLSEHGKHVDGHIQNLNSADGKVLFDQDAKSSKYPVNLVPLQLYWSGRNQDNFVTATRKGVDEALAAGYRFVRTEACVADADTKRADLNVGSRALKMFWSLSRGDHFSAASRHGESDATTAGYQFIRNEGFIFPSKQPDTVPLKLYWNASRKDNFSTATLQGAHDAELAGYRFSRIQGYVYPASNCQGNAFEKQKLPVPTQSVERLTVKGQNTLFILDASGSMWGQINGKTKITIAKEMMTKLVPELSGNPYVGLIVYGHRRKGDCSDVETLVRLGTGNQQAILSAVKALNAKGKTPLTRSVNQAIDMLRKEENTYTVVLISDGIESCGGDPCAAVKAGKASGVNFILHTVGFGLSKKESAQLQCMAKAGGGEYFQANNAEELLKSARKAIRPTGVVKLTVKLNGKAHDLMYRVEEAKNGRVIQQPVLPTASGMAIRLPAGRYNVFVSPAGVSGAGERKLSLNIQTGESIEQTLAFGKGILHLTVMVNNKPAHAYIHMEDSATHNGVYESSVFGWDTPLNIDMASGKVDVVVRAGGQNIPEQRVNGVEIMAGETTDLVIPVEMKPLASTAADANGMEQNTDRPGGGDFRHIVPAHDDPALCQKSCQAEAQCKSWTYVKPNTVQGAQPNCWLKGSVPPASHNTCCISGIRQ